MSIVYSFSYCLDTSEWTIGQTLRPFKPCSQFASRISYRDGRKKYTVCYLSVHYYLIRALIKRRREREVWEHSSGTYHGLNLNQLGNIRRLLSVPLQQRSGDCAPVSIFIGMDDTVMLWSIRSRFIPKLSAGAFRLCEAEMHPYNLTSDHADVRSSAVSTI